MTEDDTFEALRRPPTEDEIAFGRNTWVYCSQHMRPHMTGWCTVENHNKARLEATTQEDAYEECRRRGYELYKNK